MAASLKPRESNGVAKILLVDDEPRNLEALEAMLEGTDLRLVRASSADEALLALLQQQFAAIVLDIRMPGTSGFELAAFIKQRKRTQHVPILFLTAHMADEQEILRGYSTGAVDYLTKPIRPEILRSKISVFVELYRKTQALERAKDALEREVVERERAEEELRQINMELERRVAERTEALEAADRRKDEFLAALSHELRNPLAPIRAAVEVMRLKGTDPQLANARGVVDRQVQHMTRLIDDLLDLSRITRDRLVLRTSRVQLADVVSAAVETSRPIIEQRGHTLTTSVPPRLAWIEADPARLAQVLSNLLTNAAKYTAHGGRIGIDARVDEREVVIAVTDNGSGIPADMLPRIFEMFMQVDRSHGRPGDGLGIGLTLARRLIEMHGGTIDAKSDGPGQGSEFSVRLPLPVSLDDDLEEMDLEGYLPELPHALKVLVVDDNRDAAEMLSTMLGAWQQEATTAFDGLSAIELGANLHPDVVLLDLGMPKIDGYETARRIRTQPWGQHCIIAAVTGWGQDADRERSRMAGFDHHLVKPVSPVALRTLLSRCRPVAGSTNEAMGQ